MIHGNGNSTVQLLPGETLSCRGSNDCTSLVVSVVGDVNWTTSGKLRARINELLTVDHPARIILDLKDVARIDSSGIGVLLGGLREASKKSVRFTLSGLRDAPRRLLERTHLNMLFDIHPTVDEALHA